MTQPLVLSLFPGIGLLDMAFEEEGFCVVRGPDLLWGGNVKRFYPPAGKFDGVIGGPPCQMFCSIRHLQPLAGKRHGNQIPEFERCVAAAGPAWFIMENVKDAPLPAVAGYEIHTQLVRDVWVGGETNRQRRISFGNRTGARLSLDQLALHSAEPEPAALGHASVRSIKIGGSGKVKRFIRAGHQEKGSSGVTRAIRVQGLPADFFGEDSPFTVTGKLKMVGNGVPLPMGRAIAKAVKRAMYPELVEVPA